MHLALKALLALIGRAENAGFKDRAAAEVKHMLTVYVDEVIRKEKGRAVEQKPLAGATYQKAIPYARLSRSSHV